MEDTIITFKTAKLAKEKWFPQEPNKLKIPYYNYKGEFKGDVKDWLRKYLRNEDTSDVESVSAPTQSLLAKWLREEHNIHIVISNNNYNKLLNWSFDLHKLPVGIIQMWKRGDDTYNTFEEAYEVGLQEALKYIL